MKSKNPNLLLLFLIAFFVGQSDPLFGVFRAPVKPKPAPAPAKAVEPATAEELVVAPSPEKQAQLEKIMADLKRYDKEADERAAKLDKMNQEIGALRQEKENLEDENRELKKTHVTGAGTEELQKVIAERNQQIETLQQRIAGLEEQLSATPLVTPPTAPPAPPVIPTPPTYKPSTVTKKVPTTLVGLESRLREENAFVNIKGQALHTKPSASLTQQKKKLKTVSSDFELAKAIYLVQHIIDRTGFTKKMAGGIYGFIVDLGKTNYSYHGDLTKLAVVKFRSVLEANNYTALYPGKKGQKKVDTINKVLSDLSR